MSKMSQYEHGSWRNKYSNNTSFTITSFYMSHHDLGSFTSVCMRKCNSPVSGLLDFSTGSRYFKYALHQDQIQIQIQIRYGYRYRYRYRYRLDIDIDTDIDLGAWALLCSADHCHSRSSLKITKSGFICDITYLSSRK